LERVLRSDYKDEEAIHLLEYITRFNNEYHKNVIKKNDPKALHNTEKLRKECYARENARNRDIMSSKRHCKLYLEEIENIADNEISIEKFFFE
jgi:hypothetical protein